MITWGAKCILFFIFYCVMSAFYAHSITLLIVAGLLYVLFVWKIFKK